MFTLGIPLKQKRRTLGYLSNEYFPGGMKKLGQVVNYKILSTDDGFFQLGFPGMDENEFRDIVFKLKQQGVTVIGADSQLTEDKTMKLADLVPLQERRLQPPKGFTGELVKKLVDADKDTMFFSNGKYYIADETAEQDYIDSLFVIDRDANPEELNFREIEFAEGDAIKPQFIPGLEEEIDEGSCGYAPEGEDPNKADQPAGPHLLRKEIKKQIKQMMESFADDPNVPGVTGMEDTVNDPNAKAEKILNQLAKRFGDIPLNKVVNDSTYKRQAIIAILFGMAN